jgi:hypothetical protein
MTKSPTRDLIKYVVCLLILIPPPPPRQPYFGVVGGSVWSSDTKSYAGGSVATGRLARVKQVKGDDSDKQWYHGSPYWGLGVELITLPLKKALRNLKEEAKAHLGQYGRW